MPDTTQPASGGPAPPEMEGRVRRLEIEPAVLKQIAAATQASLDRIDARLERLERRLERLEDRVWAVFLWLVGTGVAAFGALFAAMGHGFHWW